MDILVEWTSWWNGHPGGMDILVEWTSCPFLRKPCGGGVCRTTRTDRMYFPFIAQLAPPGGPEATWLAPRISGLARPPASPLHHAPGSPLQPAAALSTGRFPGIPGSPPSARMDIPVRSVGLGQDVQATLRRSSSVQSRNLNWSARPGGSCWSSSSLVMRWWRRSSCVVGGHLGLHSRQECHGSLDANCGVDRKSRFRRQYVWRDPGRSGQLLAPTDRPTRGTDLAAGETGPPPGIGPQSAKQGAQAIRRFRRRLFARREVVPELSESEFLICLGSSWKNSEWIFPSANSGISTPWLAGWPKRASCRRKLPIGTSNARTLARPSWSSSRLATCALVFRCATRHLNAVAEYHIHGFRDTIALY